MDSHLDIGAILIGGSVESFEADDAERLLRGVVGGVTADAARAGLRCFDGDGVFSTSTSLSDDELLEDEVVSTISRDFGAPDCRLAFFDGRPGRLLLTPPPVDVSLADVADAPLPPSFFGRPRPRRLGPSAPAEDDLHRPPKIQTLI